MLLLLVHCKWGCCWWGWWVLLLLLLKVVRWGWGCCSGGGCRGCGCGCRSGRRSSRGLLASGFGMNLKLSVIRLLIAHSITTWTLYCLTPKRKVSNCMWEHWFKTQVFNVGHCPSNHYPSLCCWSFELELTNCMWEPWFNYLGVSLFLVRPCEFSRADLAAERLLSGVSPAKKNSI